MADEVAATREPDLVQCLNVASPDASFHQIGDHKQLPATVNHPQNRADNNEVSLFERLIETACLPCVVLQEQHRMQPSIAAFPSMQYYSDSLTTRTPLRSRAPAGFYWLLLASIYDKYFVMGGGIYFCVVDICFA